jgi:hypothetical protein
MSMADIPGNMGPVDTHHFLAPGFDRISGVPIVAAVGLTTPVAVLELIPQKISTHDRETGVSVQAPEIKQGR